MAWICSWCPLTLAPYFEVADGKLEEFKAIARRAVEARLLFEDVSPLGSERYGAGGTLSPGLVVLDGLVLAMPRHPPPEESRREICLGQTLLGPKTDPGSAGGWVPLLSYCCLQAVIFDRTTSPPPPRGR